MSIKIMSQVWELELPAAEKLIALALADHANDQGICAPSFSRIAWKCGISRDTVKRALRRFRDSGLVLKTSEAGGPGRPAVWRIFPSKGVTLPPFTSDLARSRAVEKPVENSFPVSANGGHGGSQRGASAPGMGGTAMPWESKTGIEDLEPKEGGRRFAASALPVENPEELRTAVQQLAAAKSFGGW
jgi:Helix-turn-helix domain